MLTHAHEDHIGAVPYLLRAAGRHPAGGLAADAGPGRQQARRAPDLARTTVEVARRAAGSVRAVRAASSSRSTTRSPTRWPSPSGPPAGMVLHTGDFKMDQLPLDGRLTDLGGFARLGAEGVDLLLADSTNAEVPGIVTSERDIGPVLDDVFARRAAADHRGLLRQPRAPRAAGHGRRRHARPQGRAGRPVHGPQHGRGPRPGLPARAERPGRPAGRHATRPRSCRRTRSC